MIIQDSVLLLQRMQMTKKKNEQTNKPNKQNIPQMFTVKQTNKSLLNSDYLCYLYYL